LLLAGTLAVAWICLSGCASSGLYTMSDDWCMRHPQASAAHCGHHPQDVAQQVGGNTISRTQDDGS
jgi:hypothetical protein